MAKSICQYLKILELSVDCFSTCHCHCLHINLIFTHSMLILDPYLAWLTLITLICFNHLPWQKLVDHLGMKNGHVIEHACCGWTVNPNNQPCLYDSELIPQPCFAELVGKEILCRRLGFTFVQITGWMLTITVKCCAWVKTHLPVSLL